MEGALNSKQSLSLGLGYPKPCLEAPGKLLSPIYKPFEAHQLGFWDRG